MKTIKHFRRIILITLALLTIGSLVHAVLIKNDTSPDPYTVNVGTFESYEKAEKLANIIKSHDYSPWIRSYSYNGETTHGVYLGAFESKEKAEVFAQSMQKRLSFIANYVIVEMKENQPVIKQSQIVKVTTPTTTPVAIPAESAQKPTQASTPITKDLKSEPTVQPSIQVAKKLNSSIRYTIRVGKFVNYENVKNILNVLRSDNCNPWMKAYSYKGRITYWVYADVFDSKGKAEEFAQSMQKKLPNIIDDYVIVSFRQNQPIIKPSTNVKVVAPTAIHIESAQKPTQALTPITKDLKPDVKPEPTVQPTTQVAKKPNNRIQYSVRVGKFANYENAEKLFNVLKADNCNPWMKAYSYRGRVTYWLYAGRFEAKDKAEEFAQSIRKRLSYIEDYVIMGVRSGIR